MNNKLKKLEEEFRNSILELDLFNSNSSSVEEPRYSWPDLGEWKPIQPKKYTRAEIYSFTLKKSNIYRGLSMEDAISLAKKLGQYQEDPVPAEWGEVSY